MRDYKYFIGIDPGTDTGLAVWNASSKSFEKIETKSIHQAFELVLEYKGRDVFVIVEDASKRKWFGDNAEEKKLGAGSIKRDCSIWRDFLSDKGIDSLFVHPMRGGTKIDAKRFKAITGWGKRSSHHARDAAMLVYDRKRI
ncbi:hypothetical protein V6R21_20225 [Limibacter armeniacum]|uniref:hypothetical protein n=1 Tax=Limibacter armeniacum TaxID=466084 RepID=UPI002FE6A323